MPKLAQTEEQTKDLILRSLVDKNMVLRGIRTKPELAKRIGRSHTALYDKLANPEKFTVLELRRLFKVLHFTEEERRSIW